MAKTPSLNKRKGYTVLVLAVLSVLVYANTVRNGYNMDDELVTRKHKLTSKGLTSIGDIFTSPYYSDAMGYTYGYRPMVHTSFAVEHALFGESAATSHFINVLLFALCVAVFFRLLKRLAGEKGEAVAVLATLLFALHPVHVETVASIKNRDEILALLFGLLAGREFLAAFDGKTIRHLFFALLCFLAALLSKKSIYPLAIIFPLIALFVEQRDHKKVLWFALVLILPGALLGSEFDPSRFVGMLLIPYILLGIFGFLRQMGGNSLSRIGSRLSRFLGNVYVLSVLLWLLSGIALWSNNAVFYALAFAAAVFIVYKDPRAGVPQLAVLLLAFGLRSASSNLLLASSFLAVWYGVHHYRQKKELWGWLWVLAVAGIYWIVYFSWGNVLGVALFAGWLLLVYRKFWWGIIGFPLVMMDAVWFETEINLFKVLLLVVALTLVSAHFFPRLELSRWMAIPILAAGLVFFHIQKPAYFADVPPPVKKETVVSAPVKNVPGTKLPKEGRKLEFAENTLVVPHTDGEKIGMGIVTLNEYLRLMAFPYELSFYYGYARIHTTGLAGPWVWLGILWHAGLLLLAIRQLAKRPLFGMGIFWYLFSIGLFSNWVELVAGMVGERLAFTASAGFCIALAVSVFWLKPAFSLKKIGIVEVGVGMLLLAFGVRTLLRNTDWKDAVTLMGTDIAHLENSAQANNLYALNLMQASFEAKKYNPQQQLNMRKLAVVHFDRALQIWPEFFNAAYDKGRAAQMIGDIPAAIDGFEKAAAMKHADFMDPNYQLSDLYLKTGRYPDFLKNAKAIFEVEHTRPEAYNLVARGFFLNSRTDSAKVYLRRGLEQFPSDAGLKNNLAEIFKMEGRPDSADYYLLK